MMRFTRMKAPVIATVNVYDSTPLNQVYQLYLRLDPSPNRNWTIDETKFAAGVWAEKFLALDSSLFPGWLGRLRYEVSVAPDNQILPKTDGYAISEGVTVFVDEAPTGSRLLNPVQMGVRIMMLRSEIEAQVPVDR
jgi:hypothetical protein